MFAAGIPMRVRASAGREPHQADAALRAGADDLRILELDEPVGELAAGAQLLHDQELDLHLVPGSVRAEVEQLEPGRRRRERAVRAAAARTSRTTCRSPTARSASRTTGQKLKWYGGPWAHVYDVYFGTSPNPPLFAAEPGARPERDDVAGSELHAADADRRHHLLLEDRLEDGGQPDQDRRHLELHDRRHAAAAAAAAAGRDDARAVGVEHAGANIHGNWTQDYRRERVGRIGALEPESRRGRRFHRRWRTPRTTSSRRSRSSTAPPITCGCGCAPDRIRSATIRCTSSSAVRSIRSARRTGASARRAPPRSCCRPDPATRRCRARAGPTTAGTRPARRSTSPPTARRPCASSSARTARSSTRSS